MKALNAKHTKAISGGNSEDKPYKEEVKDVAKHTGDKIKDGARHAGEETAHALDKIADKLHRVSHKHENED